MITVEEIYRRMEQKESADKKAAEEKAKEKAAKSGKKWKPDTIDEYTVPEFNLPDSEATAAGQKKYGTLSKILTFVDLAQRLRTSEGCTIMPIAVTSPYYIEIFGSEMNVSRAVDRMIEIGILGIYDETYRHHAPFPYDDENKSKSYKYYYDNEQKFLQYCKKHNIEKYVPVCKHEFSAEELETINKVKNEYREFEISDVKFSSDLDLIMPLGLKRSEFKLFLEWCLYQNYPMFGFYLNKMKEINERYYKSYPDIAIKFKPHFTWKKGKNFTRVIKIGIRSTNKDANKSKKEREDILDRYGMRKLSDIESSVPRLTLSLNTGEWVDETVDIYEIVNSEFEPEAPFTEERRKAIKKLFMFPYFETHSDANMGKNVWNRMAKEGADRNEVYEVMRRLKEAIIKVEGGKLYGSEIFYVESCVYLMTVYDLLSAGHNVWLIYDAFYSKGETYADCAKCEKHLDYTKCEEYSVCPKKMIANSVRENFRDFYTRDFCHWCETKGYEEGNVSPQKFEF